MALWSERAFVLGSALLLDATLGEPWTPLHPVVWMGHAIAPFKRLAMRPLVGPWLQVLVGAIYALSVAGGFAWATWWLQRALEQAPWLGLLFEVHTLLGCFALKGLVAAGEGVRVALAARDVAGARRGLGSLCSRDASELEPSEVAGAAIESLTENTSDSVVAPLFYYVLFGLPGAVFYRAANTLDAMVGYHGRYEYLGKFAARLDDVLNLLPARLTTLGLAFSGAALRLDVRRGLRVWWRDRGRTESPNAGHPMAMSAGLLGVQLDKRGAYVLGAGQALPDQHRLSQAQRLVRVTGWLFAGLAVALTALQGRGLRGF